MAEKLRRLQRQLKVWNWEVFGDVRVQVKNISNQIESLESNSQQIHTDAGVEEMNNLKTKLAQLLRWESELLFQKTRVKWLTEGDRNTRSFHAIIKDRRSRNTIKLTQTNGAVINENKS